MPEGNANRPDPATKGKGQIKDAGKPRVSRRKLWLFRLAAATIVPLLLLACCELVLRLAGFGYPTDFLLRTQIQGRDFFIPNEKFGFRFFPAEIARTPTPL